MWSADDETTLLSRLARLLAGPIDDARIEQAFGELLMSGRTPERFLRGPTWKLVVMPIEAPVPKSVEVHLQPHLPLERVLAGLSWPPMLVSTSGVHQASAHVIDPTTRRVPVLHGSRVEIDVPSVTAGQRSAVDVPAQRVYETANLIASGVRIRVGKA